MTISLYILGYFLLLFCLMKMSPVMAMRCIKKNYVLMNVKFIVWFYLISFIINLTILTIISLMYYFNLISLEVLINTAIIISMMLLVSITYLAYKLF